MMKQKGQDPKGFRSGSATTPEGQRVLQLQKQIEEVMAEAYQQMSPTTPTRLGELFAALGLVVARMMISAEQAGYMELEAQFMELVRLNMVELREIHSRQLN